MNIKNIFTKYANIVNNLVSRKWEKYGNQCGFRAKSELHLTGELIKFDRFCKVRKIKPSIAEAARLQIQALDEVVFIFNENGWKMFVERYPILKEAAPKMEDFRQLIMDNTKRNDAPVDITLNSFGYICLDVSGKFGTYLHFMEA